MTYQLLLSQNIKMLHNFKVWKFCENAQFGAIHPKFCGNCASLQNFDTRELREIAVFHHYIAYILHNHSKMFDIVSQITHATISF